mgnify:CR=1 FL=1
MLIILKLINALIIHFWLEKLCLRYLVNNTANAINKNQIEKKNDIFLLKIVVTISCISPQKIKVNSNEMATGKIFFNGLNINFPR